MLAQQHQELEGEARELLPLVPLETALHDAPPRQRTELDPPSFYRGRQSTTATPGR